MGRDRGGVAGGSVTLPPSVPRQEERTGAMSKNFQSSRVAETPAAAALRGFAVTALGLMALMAIALSAGPGAAAETRTESAVTGSATAKSPSQLGGGRALQSPTAGYPKGGLSAADARAGFKPSFGAKPYRYFGRHGYGTAGISRYGQGTKRN